MSGARPKSATNNLINVAGLFAAVAAYWYCRQHNIAGAESGIIIPGVYAAIILTLEVLFLRVHMRETTGLDFTRRHSSPPRIAIKLIGVYGSYGFVALLYWLFPEYHGDFYNNYWEAIKLLGPYVLVLTVPYVVFVDERMKNPHDSYYHFGKCLLLDGSGVQKIVIVQHLLGWVVKGYFMPLMFLAFIGNIGFLHSVNFDEVFKSFDRFYRVAVDIMFTIDVLAAVAGYAISMRVFDNHIRSSEPTFFGWFICLICYQPFLSIFMRYYLAYSNNSWMQWLSEYPTLKIVWGSVILLCLFVYTAASINFGVRFSNITHRGILTNGMYRFTKHPAYVFKNTFWWMMYIPFIPMAGDYAEALRYCVLMVGISAVYYLRAFTEERHLSRDPAYVEYALYMNEHSVFAPVAKRLSFLKYRKPTSIPMHEAPYMGMK